MAQADFSRKDMPLEDKKKTDMPSEPTRSRERHPEQVSRAEARASLDS